MGSSVQCPSPPLRFERLVAEVSLFKACRGWFGTSRKAERLKGKVEHTETESHSVSKKDPRTGGSCFAGVAYAVDLRVQNPASCSSCEPSWQACSCLCPSHG